MDVADGLFTVALDFGAGAFNGDARWLEVAVYKTGTGWVVLSPRQPLLAAPYQSVVEVILWRSLTRRAPFSAIDRFRPQTAPKGDCKGRNGAPERGAGPRRPKPPPGRRPPSPAVSQTWSLSA